MELLLALNIWLYSVLFFPVLLANFIELTIKKVKNTNFILLTDFQHNYHFQISALGLFLKFRKFSLDILIKYIILEKKKVSLHH